MLTPVRLERILTQRLIRFVRAVLPFLVVVLIAIPAWNYYAKRVRKSNVTKPSVNLPGNVSVRTEGFSYSQMKGGRTQFTVHAKQSLGFKDDKYTLQDVDV